MRWVLMVLLAIASPAAAESEPHAAMTDYFDGEITGGWVLIGMGAAGLATGGYLYADGGDVARGASYVTLAMGTVHLAAGVYVNIASRVRRRVYGAAIGSAPGLWLATERKRMAGVSTQFLVLKIVEVALIAGGGTMAAIGHTQDHPRLEGAGYALAAEAAATLLFDIVAARRAARYRARLAAQSTFTTDAAGQPVLLVGTAFAF
jgi:hypothetical protein